MLQPLLLPHFKKQLKRLLKKYPRLQNSLIETLETFQKQNEVHLGRNIYKVRLQSKDISRGKNKSFRLIVLLIEIEGLLVPVTVYFKGDKANISKQELNDHLETILFELRQVAE